MTLSDRRRTDFIVGLFVLFAAVATVFIALRAANISDFNAAGGGYEVHLRFENIGSLAARSPVKSSGVTVGRVQSISYDNAEYLAEVTVLIERQYQFPVDSIFSIVSSNLLGGQYISIEVGGDDDLIKDGAIADGNSALILEHLIGKFLFDKAGE